MNTKITILMSLIFGAMVQSAVAQNAEKRSMNQDSTSIVPFDAINLVRPVANIATSTYIAPPPYNGVCGASNNSILPSAPTSFLCDKGVASAVTTNGGTYSWSCTGNNIGSPSNVASCSAQQRVVGQCGSDNGKTLSSAPTNLCASGTPSAVNSGGTNYSWTCTGNYGLIPQCSSEISLPQVCGGYLYTNNWSSNMYGWASSDNHGTINYSNNLACPGGYIPTEWAAYVPNEFYVPIDMPNYTSDGVYKWDFRGLGWGYHENTIIGLSDLVKRTPNAKFGCPPGYTLDYNLISAFTPLIRGYWSGGTTVKSFYCKRT